jgi:hypothetical protein
MLSNFARLLSLFKSTALIVCGNSENDRKARNIILNFMIVFLLILNWIFFEEWCLLGCYAVWL